MKVNGVADGLTLGRIKGMQDAVAIELPEREFGMIVGIRVTKGSVLPILRETAQVVKQGDGRCCASVVLGEIETGGNSIYRLADTKGMRLFHVETSLLQGIWLSETQDILPEPVMKGVELLEVHANLLQTVSARHQNRHWRSSVAREYGRIRQP